MSADSPGSKDSDKQRAHRRFEVEDVRGSFLVSTDARVINLSIDGLALETGSPLKVGRDYSLKLGPADDSLPLLGRVVWCSLVRTEKTAAGEVTPIYRAGLHFEDVLAGRPNELVRFIRKHAVVSLEQRLFGRFKIDREKATNVGCQSEFRVRQLSLAGMLVEMDMAPQVDSRFDTEIRLDDLCFETHARIVRAAPVEAPGGEPDGGLFLVGVEFLEMGSEAHAALEKFLDQQVV